MPLRHASPPAMRSTGRMASCGRPRRDQPHRAPRHLGGFVSRGFPHEPISVPDPTGCLTAVAYGLICANIAHPPACTRSAPIGSVVAEPPTQLDPVRAGHRHRCSQLKSHWLLQPHPLPAMLINDTPIGHDHGHARRRRPHRRKRRCSNAFPPAPANAGRNSRASTSASAVPSPTSPGSYPAATRCR